MIATPDSVTAGRGLARVLFFAVLAGALLVCVPPLSARSWRIADFNDTIAIGGDGSAYIEENITLVFVGSFQGIHRTIPTEYPAGPRDLRNYTLFLKVRSVTDEAGRALKYETSRKQGALDIKIYISGAADTTRTVRIAYTSPNAVRYLDDHDEFYWNVTGNDWPVPIDHAAAVVTLPPHAAGSLRAQAFSGVYGSHDQEVTSTVKDASAVFETTNPLPMRGGMTVDIYIPKGVLRSPSALTRLGWFLQSNSILFLPLVAFAVMFTVWWRKGKDPKAGLSVAPMYEPPPDMSPAEVGTLIDDSLDPRDITSTVVDLAVRGFIKIEETSERHLIFSSKDYIFHLLKNRTDWAGLRPHESVTLNHLFTAGQAGESTRMSSLKNHFYVALPTIKQDVIARLKEKGMYTVDPQAAGAYVVGAALLIGVPFVLLQVSGVVNLFTSAAMAAVGIGLAAVIVLLFGRQMTAKSLQGVRTKVKILGFQEFMRRVDADRLKRMPPDTFEKFLPYAMALGVENRWAQAFKDILHEPPQWYVGPSYPGYGWNPILFANSMNVMSTDMHHVMVSAPRASASGSGFGSGGFSGGGFSGGGFGGGGGSAF